jgi:hypothetical protein
MTRLPLAALALALACTPAPAMVADPCASLDCSSSGGVCTTGGPLDAWCAVPPGKTCVAPSGSPAPYYYCGDHHGPSSGMACDVDKGCITSSAVCVSGMGNAYCDLDTLVVTCTPWGQSVTRDCKALGATTCAQGSCVGVSAGGACGPQLGCAAGLTCNGATLTCDFEEAIHPTPPQVVTKGGPVLTAPKVKTISYAADPRGVLFDAFAQELTTTSYWSTTTSEYGVGPLEASAPVHLSGTPPASLEDFDVRSLLIVNTTGSAPAWGASDSNTIYTFLVPPNVPFTGGGGSCCGRYDGYHSETFTGTKKVSYAIICACSFFNGANKTDVDNMTTTTSHELVEAATDPFIASAPAFHAADFQHAAWTILSEGEVADMCEFNEDAQFIPSDGTFPVQRTWSNAAALAGQNPCVPAPKLYAGAAPILPDTAPVVGPATYMTPVVKIAEDTTGVVDVPIYTSGIMGDVTVVAYDANPYLGTFPEMDMSFDRPGGNNGDVLKLSIKPHGFNAQVRGNIFIVETHFGDNVSWAMGVVAPP